MGAALKAQAHCRDYLRNVGKASHGVTEPRRTHGEGLRVTSVSEP